MLFPEREPEWFEVYRPWLRSKGVNEYWLDFIGLGISGLFVTLPCGILLANPFLALSGALKAVAYALGWKYGGKTESGEMLTGAFLWGAF